MSCAVDAHSMTIHWQGIPLGPFFSFAAHVSDRCQVLKAASSLAKKWLKGFSSPIQILLEVFLRKVPYDLKDTFTRWASYGYANAHKVDSLWLASLSV